MRQGADPSCTAVAFDVTIDSVVVVACVVVELDKSSSDSVDVVVVVTVADVAIAVVSWPTVDKFNASAQLDTSIVGDVGSLDVEVAIVRFCDGNSVPSFDGDTPIVGEVVGDGEIDGMPAMVWASTLPAGAAVAFRDDGIDVRFDRDVVVSSVWGEPPGGDDDVIASSVGDGLHRTTEYQAPPDASSGIVVDNENCEGKGDLVDRSVPAIVGAAARTSIGRRPPRSFVSVVSTTSPVGSAYDAETRVGDAPSLVRNTTKAIAATHAKATMEDAAVRWRRLPRGGASS